MSAELRRELAEAQANFEATVEDFKAMQRKFAASQSDLTTAQHELQHAEFENGKLRAQLGEMRDARDAARAQIRAIVEQRDLVLAELRELAAFNRADGARFAGTSSPFGFGPNRAAQAYEKAIAIVEQKLGGESRG